MKQPRKSSETDKHSHGSTFLSTKIVPKNYAAKGLPLGTLSTLLQQFCEAKANRRFMVYQKEALSTVAFTFDAATHTSSPAPPPPSRALRPSATARARFCACLSTATK
uniref:Uncharacterized protein n=1 Tax=Arundo donax TaxID=35708 RepID=A0A0A8ZVL9_ARUDO